MLSHIAGNLATTTTHEIIMDDAAIIGNQFGYPVEMESKFNLELL